MRYENTSDAERRHHHPGGHGHGPGFSGFGRGGGYRRGRGRGFGRPGGWQQADLPLTDDLTAWLAGRLPDDWFTGAPQVTVDREEITVIGELPAPAASPEGGDDASAEGRISRFREETREKRMQIADEAEARYGRKVAWGASIGDITVLFTHLSVPVMTRLRQSERGEVGHPPVGSSQAKLGLSAAAGSAPSAGGDDALSGGGANGDRLIARLSDGSRPRLSR